MTQTEEESQLFPVRVQLLIGWLIMTARLTAPRSKGRVPSTDDREPPTPLCAVPRGELQT